MADRYFPHEVILNILSRLPVKSLLRFRCVSKAWDSLITSPNFISTHLLHSSTNNTHLLIKYFSLASTRELYSLRRDAEDGLEEIAELDCPLRTRNKGFFRVVGSCNGIICLSDDQFGYTTTIVLWNPAIRRFLNLPKPRVLYEVYGPYMHTVGFGFDARSNDFKVVRISYLQNKWGTWDASLGPESLLWPEYDSGYVVPPEVDVFSLSTGCWKTIDAAVGVVPPYSMIEYFWSSVFLHGNIHWVAYYPKKDSNGGFCNLITLFDVEDEVFAEFKLPNRLAREFPLNLEIRAFEDTISVLQYDDRKAIKRCSVWVMKEYGASDSWSFQFNVEIGGIWGALGFRKNGELLVAKSGGKLVSYDSRLNAAKKVGIRGGRDSIFVGSFAESLVMLDKFGGAQRKEVKESSSSSSSSSSSGSSKKESLGVTERAMQDFLEKHALTQLLFSIHLLNR